MIVNIKFYCLGFVEYPEDWYRTLKLHLSECLLKSALTRGERPKSLRGLETELQVNVYAAVTGIRASAATKSSKAGETLRLTKKRRRQITNWRS